MEYQKIINHLGKTINPTKLPKYTTRKRIEIFDQSNGSYNQNKDIRFKTSQLRSDLCDFNDAYIVVTGEISGTNKIFYSIKDSESFNYKTKFVGKLPANEGDLDSVKVVVPLKYLSKFLSSLDTLLINYKIELTLKWNQNLVLTNKAARQAIPAGDDPASEPEVDAINAPSDLKFNITGCKLYVPVVTLSAEYENKLYEELKTRIAMTVTWNKYRSQVIDQAATNNLNYFIDSTFTNVDRLLVLAFEKGKKR